LKDCPVVVDLHRLAPVGGRATGGRHWRRFERFAKVGEDLADRPRLRDERDQPDVAAAVRAFERKLLAHPGHELGPGDSRRVVRAGLLMRVAAVSGAVTVVSMPAGRDLALLTDVCDRECRDGFSQPVVRRKHPVVAMPVLPRRRTRSVSAGSAGGKGRAHDDRETVQVSPDELPVIDIHSF
jgi:hypothetical protein